MDQHNYRRYLRRTSVTYGAIMAAVPAVLAAAVLWGGRDDRPAPAFDPATMWLASSTGRLVRANALVDRPSAQIVESMPYGEARSGVRLLPLSGGLVVAEPDGALRHVDTRTYERSTPVSVGDATVVSDGVRIYRIDRDSVALLDPDSLTPTLTRRLGPVNRWAVTTSALYVSTADGALSRVDGTGTARVSGDVGGPTMLLASVDNGVAAYDATAGTVAIVHGTTGEIVTRATRLRSAAPATGFGAAPDGLTFAIIAGGELLVSTPRGQYRRGLAVEPDASDVPVVAGDRVYVTDRAAGTIHDFRIAAGLPETAPLTFGDPARAVFDVHRTAGFVWFDDVRGPIAYAVRAGTARQIIKYRVRPATPRSSPAGRPPTSKPTTRPPTSRPPATKRSTPPASRSPRPDTPRSDPTPSGRPTPSKTKSRTPSPSPSVDPRARCAGDEARLTVHNAQVTGAHPQIRVRVCVAAPGADEYWIVSISDGNWYAKLPISGSVSERPYVVDLLHGAGDSGQQRQFLVVAGRTSGARQWLHENRAADLAGDDSFPRDGPHSGIDQISERVSSTS